MNHDTVTTPIPLMTTKRLEYLGLADDDGDARLEMLIKVKTIHQAVMDR